MAATGADNTPFLWNGLYRLGGAMGGIIALTAVPLGGPLRPVLKHLLRSSTRPTAALLLLPYLGYLLFALSASYAGFAVGVVTFQLWPALFVIFMARWGRTTASAVPLGPLTISLLLLAGSGTVLVALSTPDPVGGWTGMAWGLAGAVSAAATTWNYRWADDTVAACGLTGPRALWWCLLLLFL